MTTIDRVKALIADQIGIAASDIADDMPLGMRPDTHPCPHNLDSLDHVELVILVEETFNIEIPDVDAEKPELDTADGIATYVNAVLAKRDDADTVEMTTALAGDDRSIAERTASYVAETKPGIFPETVMGLDETPVDYAAMSDDDPRKVAFGAGYAMARPLHPDVIHVGGEVRDINTLELVDGEHNPVVIMTAAGEARVLEIPEVVGGEEKVHAISEVATMPITRAELLSRGVAHNDEDDAMVMSVIEKLGWPRSTEPFGTNPTHELVEIPQVSNIAGCTFRKKPVTIEAVQFSGIVDRVPTFALTGISDWLAEACGGPENHPGSAWVRLEQFPPVFCIGTLEGPHTASDGDWIIRGIAGEIYPCKPDIFARTYDAVEPGGEAHEPL